MSVSHMSYGQCSSTGCATVADPTQLCYRMVCRVTTDHVHGGDAQLGGQQLVRQELTLTDNGYVQADFAKSTYVRLREVMAAVTPLAWAVAVDWAWVR